MNKNHVNAGYMPDCGQYGLWCYISTDGQNSFALLTPEGQETHEPGMFAQPTLVLDENQAQRLMSQLWNEGIRPNGWGHEGQVAALESHLQDMRRLVFDRGEQ